MPVFFTLKLPAGSSNVLGALGRVVFFRVKEGETSMRMNDVIRRALTVHPEDQVDQAACAMRDQGMASAVVIQDDAIVGILTERDVLTKLVAENRVPATVLVADVMTKITATPGEQLQGRIVDVLGSPVSSLEDAEGVYELALTGAPIDLTILPGE
jgi:CBS domain-containing protein